MSTIGSRIRQKRQELGMSADISIHAPRVGGDSKNS